MKVAWLTGYPTMYFNSRLKLDERVIAQPATWIVNSLNALSQLKDMELHVVSTNKELTYDQHLEDNGIHYHFLKTAKRRYRLGTLFRKDIRNIYNILNRISPDLIHSHGTEDAYSLAAVTSGYACIISIQGIITECLKKETSNFSARILIWFLIQFLEKYTVKKGKYFIAKTPFASQFIKKYNSSAVIFDIANPVNQVFWQIIRESPEEYFIVYVGTLMFIKGIDDLLEAMFIVKKRYPSARLKLIGSGAQPYIKRLEKRITKLNLEDTIEVCGFKTLPEVAKTFGKATMLVVPSLIDQSPNVVSEAMVAGVPIIATNVGGIPYMLKDRETGLLVAAKDPEGLAEQIIYLLGNVEVRKKIAENAKNIGRQHHRPDRIASLMRKAYFKVVELEKTKGLI